MPPPDCSSTAAPQKNGDPCSAANTRPVGWQQAMKRAIRSQRELRRVLGIAADPQAERAEAFPTFVPLELVSRITPGDPGDPILRQVLATADELGDQPGFVSDPVGDLQAQRGGGLLHKYDGRALIVTHGACAVHCRYCFRREFPYLENGSRKQSWAPALRYIRDDDSIEEVLLSGGDPLTLTDDVLSGLVEQIEAISHVRRLRIHTRLPIAIPQRVTAELVDRLDRSRLAVWVVVHSNHAQEIDSHVVAALDRIRRAGISVLNQAVLLAGVNDSVDALANLSLKLVDSGVLPYYLHQLDRVRGARHFWVDIRRGKQLMGQLRARLPGYAVPKYVIEQAGENSKTPIA
ncbi:L-lysine 2,3-aminomutase [Stieleria neptunia]|uniref:L-lysine 2,3-aminomutase n=1 Tax=Stieleria neptunia TaxID=2527979 RepID=A0A518HXE0_9BACT|nr:EF-P beta-lysylation protein EpmB [Stieleria neptunia]QDV45529.1 L-lysine 2,3-aminomutase [Stieleria neptunia]